MPPIPPVGPLRVIGRDDPMYVLPFDKHGSTTAPQTLEHARATLRSGGFTDVYLFSHGWNNDWATATERYRHFAEGLAAQAPDDPARRALLLGIFWPSTLLVAPWERAPAMAGDVADPAEEELAGDLGPAAAARLRELSATPLTDDEAAELAGLLAPVADPAALTAAARAIAEAEAPAGDDWGTVTGATSGPAAAGVLAKLDPRNLIRAASVWQMKDRAGRIGTTAVAPLLHDALAGTAARVHCVGHSFGAKVMLSALAAREPVRRAYSLLLLQPAVNHLCFAPEGGYRPVSAGPPGPSSRPTARTTSRSRASSTSPSGARPTATSRASRPGRSRRATTPPSAGTARARPATSPSRSRSSPRALRTRSTRRSRSRRSTRPTASPATARSATPARGGR